MPRLFSLIIATVILSLSPIASARETGEPLASTRTRQTPANTSSATPGKKPGDQTVTVRNARLEPVQGSDDAQAAVLKFDLYNEGETSVTDIVLSVAVLAGSGRDDSEPREPVVRPFRIRIDYALRSGYSVDYEIRLRNLVFDSDCVPAIEVLDSRILSDEKF
jgi:hypothetical protein